MAGQISFTAGQFARCPALNEPLDHGMHMKRNDHSIHFKFLCILIVYLWFSGVSLICVKYKFLWDNMLTNIFRGNS